MNNIIFIHDLYKEWIIQYMKDKYQSLQNIFQIHNL